MKKYKRGIVMALVLVFVGAAVYLNWSYNKNEAKASETAAKTAEKAAEKTEAAETAAEDESGLYYEQTSAAKKEENERLAAIRLSRSQSRDEATGALKTISETEGVSQESLDKAIDDMTKLTERTLKESEIESKIIAKGFSDCVVYITDDGVSVTVAGEKLENDSVAQITDLVISSVGCTAQDIKISEIK